MSCTVLDNRRKSFLHSRAPDLLHLRELKSIFPTVFTNAERDEMMEQIGSYLEPMVFASNSTMIRAHTVGTRMFFVHSGSCKVIVDGNVLATRTRGDFIGRFLLACLRLKHARDEKHRSLDRCVLQESARARAREGG
jgi:CRP-like cAMP-binding protein